MFNFLLLGKKRVCQKLQIIYSNYIFIFYTVIVQLDCTLKDVELAVDL